MLLGDKSNHFGNLGGLGIDIYRAEKASSLPGRPERALHFAGVVFGDVVL